MKKGRRTTLRERLLRPLGKYYYRAMRAHHLRLSYLLTRLLLCALVALFYVVSGAALPVGLLLAYISVNVALIFYFPQKSLRSRWVRLVPDLLDVFFISILIGLEGKLDSIWYTFYLFPIISVARYLGSRGSQFLAVMAVLSYSVIFLALGADPSADFPPFVLRCLCLAGIAGIAGNLTRDRQVSDTQLIEVQEAINDAILNDQEIEGVYKLILCKAMELTNSKRGHIRRVNGSESVVVAKRSYIEDHQKNDLAVTAFYSKLVIETRKPLRISVFSNKDIKERLGTYVDPGYPPPRSALFVPLMTKGAEPGEERVMAVIALYTHRRRHYSHIDEVRLKHFSPLIEIAEKQAEVHRLLREVAEERQSRLRLLRRLGDLFRRPGDLREVDLQEAITLVMEEFNTEEAAIFLWNEKTKRLDKVAEASTSEEVTDKLKMVEQYYALGESLTGKCFETGRPIFDNDLSSEIRYAKEYGRELKSGRVSHIMSIPLFVGANKVGVLRVLNKKSAGYLPTWGGAQLDKAGFTHEDRLLLEAIATQIVIALYKKELFEEIAKSRRYLERGIDYSPYSIIVVDHKGKVRVFNNKCELTWKRTAAEVTGMSVINLYESEEEARRIKQLLMDSPEGEITDEDAKIKDSQGKVIPIRLSATLIRDDDGDEIGSVGMFKDLQEERQHQELLLKTTRLQAIARVMGHISHDVKNKLVAAKFEIETLRNRTRKGNMSGVVEGLGILEDGLVMTANKLNNIALTHTFDVEPPKKVPIFIEHMFGDYFDHLVRLGRSSNTRITINDFPRNKYCIDADVDQMHLVLMNLYDNSISAIKEARRDGDRAISVVVTFEHEYAVIEWKDNGCGIASEELGKIFELRYTTKKFGSGLGLYWVKTIIETHEGKITVDSKAGRGTTFTFRLPILYEASSGEELLKLSLTGPHSAVR